MSVKVWLKIPYLVEYILHDLDFEQFRAQPKNVFKSFCEIFDPVGDVLLLNMLFISNWNMC